MAEQGFAVMVQQQDGSRLRGWALRWHGEAASISRAIARRRGSLARDAQASISAIAAQRLAELFAGLLALFMVGAGLLKARVS